jgi:hypothetical protein
MRIGASQSNSVHGSIYEITNFLSLKVVITAHYKVLFLKHILDLSNSKAIYTIILRRYVMTITRLSEDHSKSVLAAGKTRFYKAKNELVQLLPIKAYFRGFEDGYRTCFTVYDCGHKQAIESGIEEIDRRMKSPKHKPHEIDNKYLQEIIINTAETVVRFNTSAIESLNVMEAYIYGFLQGYTTCWNVYELHDLENEMGEIKDPTPEEIELIKKILHGWHIDHK